MISEAKAFWDPISGKVKDQIAKEMGNALQVQRYDVTTAPDGDVMGVTQPFGSNEIFLPYSKEVAGATVGDTVLVAWWGSMSNARVYYFAKGYDGGAGGGDAVIASITFPAAWTDSGNGYYTAAPTIDGVTLSAESKIDLQITAAQFLTLQADNVENLYVENDNAALTAYAVGGYPSAEITLQCTITGTQAPTPPRNPSLDMIYPIGSIYINVNNVNPGNTIGGTWERVEDDMLHVTREPLWVNEDTSADFPAQTIAIDLSSYQKVLIKVRYGTASGIRENNFMQFFCDVGEGTILWVMNYSNDFAATFTPGVNYRLATVTTAGVTFTTCAIKPLNTNSVPTTGNAGCIPWSIYGIGSESSKYVWKRTA